MKNTFCFTLLLFSANFIAFDTFADIITKSPQEVRAATQTGAKLAGINYAKTLKHSVSVKVNYDSFASDQQMLQSVGSEIFSIVGKKFKEDCDDVKDPLSVTKCNAYKGIKTLEVKLDNSESQCAIDSAEIKNGTIVLLVTSKAFGSFDENIPYVFDRFANKVAKTKK